MTTDAVLHIKSTEEWTEDILVLKMSLQVENWNILLSDLCLEIQKQMFSINKFNTALFLDVEVCTSRWEITF